MNKKDKIEKKYFIIGFIVVGIVLGGITNRQNEKVKKETDELVKRTTDELLRRVAEDQERR